MGINQLTGKGKGEKDKKTKKNPERKQLVRSFNVYEDTLPILHKISFDAKINENKKYTQTEILHDALVLLAKERGIKLK